MPSWEKRLARVVHTFLYLVVIAMPISGLVMSSAAGKAPQLFGWVISLPIAENKPLAKFLAKVHLVLAWSLLTLLFLHVSGALKHHFIDKNNILRRMWKN